MRKKNDKTMVIILGTLWHQLRQTGPDPNLTRHLSQDLRQVIQLMMLNDGNLQKYLHLLLLAYIRFEKIHFIWRIFEQNFTFSRPTETER